MITQLFWYSHHRKIPFCLQTLQKISNITLELIKDQGCFPTSKLPARVEVSFLENNANSNIHKKFFDDQLPTDVMTFRHDHQLGEILLGVEVIEQYAQQYGSSLEEELARCTLHGLLHLLDYDDQTPQEHRQMHTLQEAILTEALSQLHGSDHHS